MATADDSTPPSVRPIRAGVIGTGSLGRHHVRILAEMPEAELVGIHDVRPEVAAGLAEAHGTRVFDSIDALASEVEAVVLAVPTTDHASLGCRLLEAGVHVMVEKPMAATLEEADRLLDSAGDRVLAVGHVEFYNPAVQALMSVEEQGRYLEVQRLSPFTPRSLDVDVILDLMIHDLHLIHALDPSPVEEIRATGIEVLSPKIDMATARIELASGLVANVTASRVASEPTRKLRVFLQSCYYSLDYRDQEIKGFGLEQQGDQRTIAPRPLEVVKQEPLRAELERFLAACRGEPVRYVDGAEGRRALATALEVLDRVAAKHR